MTGATVTCSRSRQRAARKRETVSAPPSTSILRIPATRQRTDDGRRLDISLMCRQSDDLDTRRRRAARPFGRDQQPTNAIVGEHPGVGSETPPRINDGAHRLRTRDLPDRQLRIVGDGRSNTDDDDVDQRTQPMKVLDTGWTINILRMARSCRDPTVKRLAELAHDHQIIHGSLAQGTEQICPNLRKRLLSVTK